MTFSREFTDHPASENAVLLRSAEESEAAVKRFGLDYKLRQLEKGQFESRLAFVQEKDYEMLSGRFSNAFYSQMRAPEGKTAIVLPQIEKADIIASGCKIENRDMLIIPDGTDSDIVTKGRSGAESIMIPHSRFESLLDSLYPNLDSRLGTSPEVIRGDIAELDSIKRKFLSIVSRPDSDPDGEQATGLISECLIWLVESIGNQSAETLRSLTDRSAVAKKAREYIEANFSRAIRLEDLCRETGTGVRTLQRSFAEYFQFTISDFLKSFRLDSARRLLTTQDSQNRKVMEIARTCGINHFGRFSVEYRERFGESPSITLAGTR